jgi:nucleoside-diphosphate-sugar epimerase
VRGRNSDNTMAAMKLRWAPKVSLEEGLIRVYTWIEKELKSRHPFPL